MLFENKIKYINVNKIQFNKINPNHMPSNTMKKLKLSMTKFTLLNPIIVRKIAKDNFEIVDGEHRLKAARELGWSEIQAKIIEATEEDVAKLILATTIKGKHNLYETLDIVEKLKKTEDQDTLSACNLDKLKVERRIKYHGSKKIKIVKPKGNKRDEKDGVSVKLIEDYKRVVVISLEEYEELKKLAKK